MASYGGGALFEGKINGEPNEVSGSHGEAGSSYKGKQSVELDNGVLTFKRNVTVKLFGVPAGSEKETFVVEPTKTPGLIKVTYKTFEGAIGIGKRTEVLCAYKKN